MSILQRVIIKKVLGCIAAATILAAGLGFGVGLKPDQVYASSGGGCTHDEENGVGMDVCTFPEGNNGIKSDINLKAIPQKYNMCYLADIIEKNGNAIVYDTPPCGVRHYIYDLTDLEPTLYWTIAEVVGDGNTIAHAESPKVNVTGSASGLLRNSGEGNPIVVLPLLPSNNAVLPTKQRRDRGQEVQI